MLAVCTMDYWTMDDVGVIITYYILFMKAGCPVTFINKKFVKTKAERGEGRERSEGRKQETFGNYSDNLTGWTPTQTIIASIVWQYRSLIQ